MPILALVGCGVFRLFFEKPEYDYKQADLFSSAYIQAASFAVFAVFATVLPLAHLFTLWIDQPAIGMSAKIADKFLQEKRP